MSWWPSSSSSANTAAQQQSSTPPQPTTTASPVQNPSDTPIPPSSNPPPPPPTIAPHDPDFYAAHPHLAPPSFSSNTNSAPSDPSSDPSDDLDPSLPRSMSCRAAFDSAFYCSSLGGHFNDLYRYGQLRSCSDHWNDFWFCMRTKNSYSGRDVKERLVQERYREKEEKLKGGPNSEHVWARREMGEEVKGAFARPAEGVDSS
ncbi:hypothetical protein EJ02DRAFT_452155 [Clathrospora elynae]|uniref:Early meiotic induction protein 1 n=1 Tax=Clathrospora elynae TaxID=706981 RepID=A0A6A5SWE4_9PLEO|nr:hypothetical protein EJ02DRAFT_452155 [Clathrospora elynae]